MQRCRSHRKPKQREGEAFPPSPIGARPALRLPPVPFLTIPTGLLPTDDEVIGVKVTRIDRLPLRRTLHFRNGSSGTDNSARRFRVRSEIV